MKYTKLVAYALSGMLAVTPLAACGNADAPQATQEETSDDTQQEIEDTGAADTTVDPGQTAGGWEMDSRTKPSLTDEQTELFDRALANSQDEVDDEVLTPVALVATQLVSGTNYAYLCTSEPTEADDERTWTIAVVYENLENEAEITSVEDIELTDLDTLSANADENTVGAWEVLPAATQATLPAEAQTAFDEAVQSRTDLDVDLSPVALLGSQVVSGTNYMVLCTGQAADSDSSTNLYVAQVYADLNDTYELTSVEPLDFLEYID